jgi:hypothetical protein
MGSGRGIHWWVVGQGWSGTSVMPPTHKYYFELHKQNVQVITLLRPFSVAASQLPSQLTTPALSSHPPLSHSLHSIEWAIRQSPVVSSVTTHTIRILSLVSAREVDMP